MENFSGKGEQADDSSESSVDKKEKKDAKELARKASLLELFQRSAETEDKKPEKVKEESNESQELEPAEELDQAEKVVVSEQLLDNRLAVVEAELEQAPDNSDEALEAVAAATFLEKVGAKLQDGEIISDQMLEEATAESADELGIPVEPTSQAEGPDEEALEEAEEVDDTFAAATTTMPTPPTQSTPAGNGSGSNPPTGSSSGFGPFNYGAAPNVLAGAPNIAPEPEQEKSHSHTKYVLAGGLLGYLIGRRGGRIRTERKLLPVQKKLESQVSDLNEKIMAHENTIRALAISNRESVHSPSKMEVKQTVKQERKKRAEALKVYAKPVQTQPEKIGKFVLLPSASPERPRSSETMSDSQQIEVAKNILMGGTSLEVLYKVGRIELKDLKEIVQRFLRGADYEKLLIKSVKPEQFEAAGATAAEQFSALTAELFKPNHHSISTANHPEYMKYGVDKETHVVARVAIVAGAVMAVVLIAVVVAFWLLGAL